MSTGTPFIIMHEFYHHLRYFGGEHRGTERGANAYAGRAIKAYLKHFARREDPCREGINA
ncbi:MAG: hypothetical protein J7L55_04100 [Desulfurococcales archaeon]|nr:hypothetical protein [Desulfurococcales archaeon]